MIIRHGDILLKKIEKLPEGLKKLNHHILAEGEVTGHRHELTAGVLYAMDTEPKFVRIDVPATITHQEHKPLEVATGIYEVIREREFDYCSEEIARVAD